VVIQGAEVELTALRPSGPRFESKLRLLVDHYGIEIEHILYQRYSTRRFYVR